LFLTRSKDLGLFFLLPIKGLRYKKHLALYFQFSIAQKREGSFKEFVFTGFDRVRRKKI